MSREVHVRFCEGLGVRFPRATHPYIATEEGWLYVAIVMDLFSRKFVGWAMSAQIDGALTLSALHLALGARSGGSDLLHHSDRGVPQPP